MEKEKESGDREEAYSLLVTVRSRLGLKHFFVPLGVDSQL